MEQYLAFVDKTLEEIVSPSPARTPVVVTQQEKDTLLATVAARKVVDFTGNDQIPCLTEPCPSFHLHPLTHSFQADQVSPLPQGNQGAQDASLPTLLLPEMPGET